MRRGARQRESQAWWQGNGDGGRGALALKVVERNSSGADALERRGFSWIELTGEATTPIRGGKVGKRQDPHAPIAWAGSARCPDEWLGAARLGRWRAPGAHDHPCARTMHYRADVT
jgi:hypothetical protein